MLQLLQWNRYSFVFGAYNCTSCKCNCGRVSTKCNSCDSTFEDKDSLKSHTESVHKRKKPYKNNIWSHFEILTDDPSHVICFKCKCKLSKSSIKALKKHLTTNKHNKSKLAVHVESSLQDVVNNSVSIFESDEISEASFKNHVNEEHGNNYTLEMEESLLKYKCSDCTEAFFSKTNLENHIEISHDNSIVETIHEHQDEKKKPFKCTSCDSTFEDKDSLKIHTESIHEGEKPFKCSLCNKSFSLKGNLKMHINIVHEGIKPHNCSKCDKSFSLSSQLIRHVDIVHGNEKKKPLKCTSCDSTFEETDSLKEHKESVHGERNNKNYADFPNSSSKIENKESSKNKITLNEYHVETNIMKN